MTFPRCDDRACERWHCANPPCGAHPDTPELRPFCAGCDRRVRAALAQLPRLHDLLLATLPVRTTDGERVSGTRNPPLPPGANTVLDALMIRDLLIGWEDALRDARHWRRWSEQQRTAHTAARWLLHRAGYLLAGDMAVDFGLELLAARWQSERALSMDRLTHRLPVPCPRCDILALIRRDGDGQVRCAGCAATWSQDDYDWFVRLAAAGVVR